MKPLVSFVLVTYNQAEWISQAVDAALSQSYENMEFIIQDDSSSDSTFQIIRSALNAAKTTKPVLSCQNDKNLGIGGNVSKALGKASGDLIVMAAGDDISVPERVATLVARWEKYGRPAAIGSSLHVIDRFGNRVENHPRERRFTHADDLEFSGEGMIRRHFARPGGITILGATLAYSRAVVDEFGPNLGDCLCEDLPLLGRALLLGRSIKVKEPLVLHRITGKNTSVKTLPIQSRDHTTTVRSYAQPPVGSEQRIEGSIRRKQQTLALLDKQMEDLQRADQLNLIDRRFCESVLGKLAVQRKECEYADRIKGGNYLSSFGFCIAQFGFPKGVMSWLKFRIPGIHKIASAGERIVRGVPRPNALAGD